MLKTRTGALIEVTRTSSVTPSGIPPLPSCGSVTPPSQQAYIPTFESIRYGTGRKKFNSCFHFKRNISVPFITLSYSASNTTCTRYCMWTHNGLQGLYAYNECINLEGGDSLMGHYTPPWDELSAQALAAMWPKIESPFDESAVNAFIDLPKTRNLKQQLAKTSQSFLHHGKALWLALRGAGSDSRFKLTDARRRYLLKRSAKALVVELAKTNLITEYGLKTLYSDIQALHKAMSAVADECIRFKTMSQKPLVAHYSTSLPDVDSSWSTVPTVDASRGTWLSPKTHSTYEYVVNSVKYTATMRYKYDLPKGGNRLLALGSLLDILGVNYNPRIVWDAIPYSFVVDWFLKVGEFLDQFKTRMVEPDVRILSFGHSIKYNVRILVDKTWSGGCIPGGTHRVCTYSADVYHRFPTVPAFYRAAQLGAFNIKKPVMGLSLLLSKW